MGAQYVVAADDNGLGRGDRFAVDQGGTPRCRSGQLAPVGEVRSLSAEGEETVQIGSVSSRRNLNHRYGTLVSFCAVSLLSGAGTGARPSD